MKIVLAGNPNVGKSTIFNKLTGLHQHTGNWTGKTVGNASGSFVYDNKKVEIYDLPGTYSLYAHSKEEEIARDFICFEEYDAIIVVCDATCLERNLNLVLQILEITNKVVLCVNLIDEAQKKGIVINLNKLSEILGIDVIATSARNDENLNELIEATFKLKCSNFKIKYNDEIENSISYIEPHLGNIKNLNSRFVAISLISNDTNLNNSINKYLERDLLEDKTLRYKLLELKENMIINDNIAKILVKKGEEIANEVLNFTNADYDKTDRKIDKLLTNKITGIPIMLLLLMSVLLLTIVVANYPSEILFKIFSKIEIGLNNLLIYLHFPLWLKGILVDGVYHVLSWVISVMLPPMAIFFPIFTLLEDFGLLPRIAFNLDGYFKKSHTCGKQALTMCMGFGCNAVGVTGTRIIDSVRERLIAIITNVFTPCNGRFPIIISIITMFLATTSNGFYNKIISVLILMLVILFSIILTLFISFLLSKTILKGYPSSFILELPPYRKPQIGKVIVRSLFDRTVIILYRSIIVAAPTGALIWILANLNINGNSILFYLSNFLNPFGNLFGLDGVIMLAFILGFPANEIVIPIIIMCYLSTGSIIQIDNLQYLKQLFLENNWNIVTAICMLILTVCHFPCSTTCLTIKKETKSLKLMLMSIIIPTVVGLILCYIVKTVSLLIFNIF